MEPTINLIAFGTFGNPNGFKQTYFNANAQKALIPATKTFDLNTNAINVFPGAKLYGIRKEWLDGRPSIAYSIYTHAKEQHSERSGTFVGSSILFTEKISEELLLVNQLNAFHEYLVLHNVKNEVIAVKHSSLFTVVKPKGFDTLYSHLKAIENVNFQKYSNSVLVVYGSTKAHQLSSYFKQSLDLLEKYDAIYFTDSEEVAKFVMQKSIFKLIQDVAGQKDFEQEIALILKERAQKKDKAILAFETEIQKLHEQKEQTLMDFEAQIAEQEILHFKNINSIQEAKATLTAVRNNFDAYQQQTEHLFQKLKTEAVQIEEIQEQLHQNKLKFYQWTKDIHTPKPLIPLQEPKTTAAFNAKDVMTPMMDTDLEEVAEVRSAKPFGYQITTYVLLFLLLGSWMYFLYFLPNSTIENKTIAVQNTPPLAPQNTDTIPILTPIPNAELNIRDQRIIARRLSYHTPMSEVVQLIFDQNPTDIKAHYAGQETAYAKQLLKLNPSVFLSKAGETYFEKDTLRHIPSFKK